MTAGDRHDPTDRYDPPDPDAAPPDRPDEPATIDLHSHTLRSDGVLTPHELVEAAAAVGVRLLSITDHDTLAGVRELHEAGAVPASLELVPGIELNAVAGERPALAESEVHVLGLGVDVNDEGLEATLAQQRLARRTRFDLMLQRLRGLGLDVEPALAALPASTDEDALGRPRMARALIAIGAATSVSDAFDRWLSSGRPGYVSREGVGPIEAIHAIRAAGGLPSLAHFSEALDRRDILRELVDAGLRGLEAHHRSFDCATAEAMAALAAQEGLVVTGGTDYHGDRESYAEAHAQLGIPDGIELAFRAALGGVPG